MNLPFLKTSEPNKNFFLSLLVKPYKIGAILFEEINDKLFILSTNEADVDADIDQISQEELLAAADRAISACETSLPEGANVEKTIFSLPYDWIEESKIKDTYLEKLKVVCKSLDLVPIGYLTSIEAIVHFIDKNEGAPVSAVFFEITKNRVFVYLVKAGKIIDHSSRTVSDGVIETCEELLKKIVSVDVLPAKIILLDFENSKKAQQEFLSHKWTASIPFLHVPQVVVLEKGFENEAVVNGVAQQMELEVLSDVKDANLESDTKSEILASDVKVSEAAGEDFGFIKDDVAKIEKPVIKESAETAVSATEGFESDSLENVSEAASKKQAEALDVNYFKENEEEITEEAFPTESKMKMPAFNLLAFTAIIKKIKIPKIAAISQIGGGSKNKIILIVGIVVVFLIAFSYSYYNFILQAEVNIFADQRAVDKSQDISFATDATGDEIKIESVEIEIKGDEDKNTTGKKETGDKAKGSLLIYNKTENPKTFSKGTIIVGPNNLEFTTIDDVKIASTSPFSTSLSSASVKVEASKFGKEYNLPSSTNFTLKGLSSSDFIAKNSDATSGGSSKTTTVVSKKDLSDLVSLLTQKLASEAISKAESEKGSDQVIFPDVLAVDVKDTKYTKKENDEAQTVGLSATVIYSIGKYEKSEVDKVVASISKNEVPGTYVMQKGDSKIEIKDIKIGKSGDSATATLKVNAVYSPQIDQAALSKSLAGKTAPSADEKLRKITGISDVNIQFKNQLPLFPTFLPFNTNNIKVEIKHE